MENLPVEVIGNILSQLGDARDVVVASATSRKWREAWRVHLHSLSFSSKDCPRYRDFSTTRLEVLITETILQTRGLHSLTIFMDHVVKFSAASVTAWLHTRETLRKLDYNVRTPNVNILEKCGRHKLEVLELEHNCIRGIEPTYMNFPCLLSLSLCHVTISALDLSLLLTLCPKLEVLELINPQIAMSEAHSTMELSSSSLKDVYVEAVSGDKLVLEVEGLEELHLKYCTFMIFELASKGNLRTLKLEHVSVTHIDIGESAENLEVVDVSSSTIVWPKFYRMISRSPCLRKLRLWNVVFDDEDEVVHLETISVCFPQLSQLSLNYDLRDGVLRYNLHGSWNFENVVVLELGWMSAGEIFVEWVSGLLERCPRLRKLIIYGAVSEANTPEERKIHSNVTSSMVRLMRRYVDIEISFEFV